MLFYLFSFISLFLVPPKIQPSHHLLKAIVGQFVDLPCLAHGDPMPEIRWYRGDEALLQGARDALDGPDGSVSIEDVELSDTGVYRCVATNNVGQDVSEMTLMVLGKCTFRPPQDLVQIRA